MSPAHTEPANLASGPDDPPAQQEPTHDVPVYPEHDPPPGQETTGWWAYGGENDQPVQGSEPGEGQDDVDEDDLDPKVPHSPPDAGKRSAAQRYAARKKVIFDENKMAG